MANNNKSNKSNKSNNSGKGNTKNNWMLLLGVVLLVGVVVAIYYMKLSIEGFISSNGGKNNNLSMKNSNKLISNTNIASKLNPA